MPSEEQVAYDEYIQNAVRDQGGPSQFTINFLRSIKGVPEDDLSEEEQIVTGALRAAGSPEAFVEKLRSFYGVEDSLPGGGPTARFVEPTPPTELLGEAAEAAAGAATEGIRGEIEPEFLTPARKVASALPGDVLRLGAGLLSFPVSVARKLAFGDARGAIREFTGLEMQAATGEAIGETGLQEQVEERPLSTLLGALGPLAIAGGALVPGIKASARAARGRRAFATAENLGEGFGKAAEANFAQDIVEVQRLQERFTLSERLNALDESISKDPSNAYLRSERERIARRRHGLDRSRPVEIEFLDDPENPVVRPTPEKPLKGGLMGQEPLRTIPTRAGRRRMARRIPAQEETLAGAASEEIARLHNENGGLTFLPKSGAVGVGAQGDVVSIFPERTTRIPGKEITPADARSFILQNRDLLLRDDPRHAVGTWYDAASNETFLDISVLLAEDGLGEAVGKAANQRAIFRLSTGEEIKTGGSGEMTPEVLAILGPEKGRLSRLLASAPRPEPVVALADGTKVSAQPLFETAATAGVIAVDGVVAQATARHPILRALSGAYNPIPDVVRAFSDLPRLWKAAARQTRPTNFEVIMKVDPILGERAAAVMAARSHAQMMRVSFLRGLREILKTKTRLDNFVKRYWIQEQLEATEGGKGRVVIDPSIIEKMDSDPATQVALAYQREQITPFLERLAPAAGIDAFRPTPNGYMKLYPGRIEGGDIVFIDGRRITRGENVLVADAGRSLNPYALTKQKARAARRASGTAEIYSADAEAILEHAVYDRLSAGARNLLFERLREIGTPLAPGDRLPLGKRQIWVPTEGAEAGSLRLERLGVPEEIALLYNDTLKPFVLPDGGIPFDLDAANAINRTFTAANLIGLGDAVFSYLFTVGTVYNELGLKSFRSKSLGALAQLPLHIPRVALAIAKVMNTHGPEATAWSKELSLVGSLRGRQIAELADVVGWKRALPWRAVAKLSFGLPEFEKGILGGRGMGGWDTRGRVALAQVIQAEQPNLTKAQVAAIVNDRAGSYVPGLRAPLATAFMKSIIVTDPFASRFVAGLKNTGRAATGLNSRGFSPALLGNSLIGVGLSAVLLNRALNGIWPWDEADLKPGDIRIRQDDGTIRDLSFGKWAFTVARATAPLREAWTTYDRGGSLGEVMLSGARGSVNMLVARMSPAIDFLFTATTGRTSYITEGGELLKIAREGTNQLKENLAASLQGLLQAPDAWIGLDPETLHPTPEAQQEATAMNLLELFGLAPRRRPPEVALIGARVRREKGHRRRIAADVAFRTRERYDANPDLDIVMESEKLLHSRGVLPDAKDYYEILGLSLRIFKAASRGRERSAEEALSEDVQ